MKRQAHFGQPNILHGRFHHSSVRCCRGEERHLVFAGCADGVSEAVRQWNAFAGGRQIPAAGGGRGHGHSVQVSATTNSVAFGRLFHTGSEPLCDCSQIRGLHIFAPCVIYQKLLHLFVKSDSDSFQFHRGRTDKKVLERSRETQKNSQCLAKCCHLFEL